MVLSERRFAFMILPRAFFEISVGVQGDLYVLSGGLDQYIMQFESRQMRDGRYPLVGSIHTNIEPNSFDAVLECHMMTAKRGNASIAISGLSGGPISSNSYLAAVER